MTPRLLDDLPRVLAIGLGATAVMDAWLLLLRRAGVPTLDFALLGRWVGHLPRGRWQHRPIARSQAVRGERALGWLTHYAVGIGFAAVLVAWQGPAWLARPALAPALGFGLVSAAAPLLLLQPALGAGLLARRTPRPLANGLRSLANHAVFGLGLYLSAALLAALAR